MVTSDDTTPSESVPPFRLDNDQLAFRFTATLTDRYGTSVERLPTPERLEDWLVANELTADGEHADIADLELARRLREAIHAAGIAVARGDAPDEADREVINELLREEQLCPELGQTGLSWRPVTGHHVRGALSIVAYDAVALLGGPLRDRVKTCEDTYCGGLYLDASRGRNRRWCSMRFCGNRAKKAKFRGARSAERVSQER